MACDLAPRTVPPIMSYPGPHLNLTLERLAVRQTGPDPRSDPRREYSRGGSQEQPSRSGSTAWPSSDSRTRCAASPRAFERHPSLSARLPRPHLSSLRPAVWECDCILHHIGAGTVEWTQIPDATEYRRVWTSCPASAASRTRSRRDRARRESSARRKLALGRSSR